MKPRNNFEDAKKYLDLLFNVPLSLSDKLQLLKLVRKHEEINSVIQDWTFKYSPSNQAVVEFLIINYPFLDHYQASEPILQGYPNNTLNKRLKEYRESSLIASASFS